MIEEDFDIEGIFNNYSPKQSNLIPILQNIQDITGYISQSATKKLAEYMKMTMSEIYGVVSFYSQFRFSPRGRHTITVCMGTACHVKGGSILVESLERDLEIKTGECTPDRRFDLERVACLGCCAIAPVIKVDNDIYSNVTVIKLKEILDKYE